MGSHKTIAVAPKKGMVEIRGTNGITGKNMLRRALLALIICTGTLTLSTTLATLASSAHAQNYPRIEVYLEEQTAAGTNHVYQMLNVNIDEMVSMIEDFNDNLILFDSFNIHFANHNLIASVLPGVRQDEWAFFDRNNTNDVYIAYEQIAQLSSGDTAEWFPNTMNVVFHEMAHAILHINNMASPTEAQDVEVSERLADEFAFFVLSELYEDDAALERVLDQFDRMSYIGQDANQRRYADIRADRYDCLLEGKLGDDAECAQAYYRLVDHWTERLAPYIRP